MSLFRGCEYNRLTMAIKREPLTFYDMNLSAQDHQTFFTCDGDQGHKDMESKLLRMICFFFGIIKDKNIPK